MENYYETNSIVNVTCDDLEKIDRNIMQVSAFLNKQIRGNIEKYEQFVLCNRFNSEYFKNKIPKQFLTRVVPDIPHNKLIVLFGNVENSLFGVINITQIELIRNLYNVDIVEEQQKILDDENFKSLNDQVDFLALSLMKKLIDNPKFIDKMEHATSFILIEILFLLQENEMYEQAIIIRDILINRNIDPLTTSNYEKFETSLKYFL
jgi:hypothetical protein